MYRVSLAICLLFALLVPAQARPLANVRSKLKERLSARHEPTQVQQQDAPSAAKPERTLLRNRQRSAAGTQPPSGPAASRYTAPAAPADAPEEKAPKTGAKPSAGLSSDESRLFAELNQLRDSRGKPPVELDPVLEQVAREQLSDPRYTPHHSPRYGSSAQHAARYAKFTSVNDVVSAGQWSDGSRCTPESSVDAWRQSPGHLRCILGQNNVNDRWIDEGYDRVGVARGKRFDLAVFGRRSNAAAECNCQQTGICTCPAGQCQCKNCPRKGR